MACNKFTFIIIIMYCTLVPSNRIKGSQEENEEEIDQLGFNLSNFQEINYEVIVIDSIELLMETLENFSDQQEIAVLNTEGEEEIVDIKELKHRLQKKSKFKSTETTSSGKMEVSGDFVVHGDLIVEGNLFVDGNLEVNTVNLESEDPIYQKDNIEPHATETNKMHENEEITSFSILSTKLCNMRSKTLYQQMEAVLSCNENEIIMTGGCSASSALISNYPESQTTWKCETQILSDIIVHVLCCT